MNRVRLVFLCHYERRVRGEYMVDTGDALLVLVGKLKSSASACLPGLLPACLLPRAAEKLGC